MNPLLGFDVLRPQDDGALHGTQFAGLGGIGRQYGLADINALQAGDTIYARPGMNPAAPEGANGFWNIAGTHQGVGGVSGTDDYQPGYDVTQWQWVENPQQQAAAPQQAPQAPREDVPAQLPIYDDWNAYRQMARAQTEGLNRMPFVFGDYHQIPTNPQDAFEMFYPGHMQGWQNEMRNPLFESTSPSFDGTGVSSNPNPTQGWGSPFVNPMFR